jgi:ABC-type enterochelin transport system permease subunit
MLKILQSTTDGDVCLNRVKAKSVLLIPLITIVFPGVFDGLFCVVKMNLQGRVMSIGGAGCSRVCCF